MSFKIEPTETRQLRILGDKSNLIGLITPQGAMSTQDRHRVELLMKIDIMCNTRNEATAFVRGAEAALRAYKILKDEEKV